MENRKIYKKPIYWVIYIFIFIELTVLCVLPFVVPANAFRFLPIMIIGIGIQLTPLLIYQLSRYKQKIIISNNTIISKGLFKDKELKFNEIKGYKRLYWFNRPLIQSHIVIQPISDLKDTIKIDLSYQNINELTDWIEYKFENLDSLKEQTDKENLLQDSRFGSTTTERQLKISQSKKIANTLNFVGFLAPLLLILTSTFANNNTINVFLQLLIIAIPILVVIAIVYFKGLIRLNQNRPPFSFKKSKDKSRTIVTQNKSIYTDVSIAILIPSIAISLVAFNNYNILDFSNVWKSSLLIAFIILTIILLVTREFVLNSSPGFGNVLFYFIFLCAFGYGSTLVLNDVLDDTKPVLYTSKIKKKTVSLGRKSLILSRSKKHKLIIEPWGQYKGRKAQIVEVSEQLYNTK